jgi:hypothetical protein
MNTALWDDLQLVDVGNVRPIKMPLEAKERTRILKASSVQEITTLGLQAGLQTGTAKLVWLLDSARKAMTCRLLEKRLKGNAKSVIPRPKRDTQKM